MAVLLRPSPGFGAALATAVFGFILLGFTFGRLFDWRLTEAGRMSVEDARAADGAPDRPGSVESAIREGIAERDRIAIMSASYGGSRLLSARPSRPRSSLVRCRLSASPTLPR